MREVSGVLKMFYIPLVVVVVWSMYLSELTELYFYNLVPFTACKFYLKNTYINILKILGCLGENASQEEQYLGNP